MKRAAGPAEFAGASPVPAMVAFATRANVHRTVAGRRIESVWEFVQADAASRHGSLHALPEPVLTPLV